MHSDQLESDLLIEEMRRKVLKINQLRLQTSRILAVSVPGSEYFPGDFLYRYQSRQEEFS